MSGIHQQLKLIKRGVVEIISEEELVNKLTSSQKAKKPLKVKAGFDPSAPDIHLGHTVLLRKMRHFQDLGHRVIFLIGDFTGRIGDPSGQAEKRTRLTKQEVLANARTYKKQITRILNPKKTRIVLNSSWYDKMDFEDIIDISSRYTVARILERDDFLKRFKQGKPISMLEFLYPLIQGYDSVKLEADIELGGTDQKFNLLVGRELQRDYGLKPQVIITTPLLIGTDGKEKMSKSSGNYIGITEPPKEIYGKLMSIPDSLMKDYTELLTDLPLPVWEGTEPPSPGYKKYSHPKDAKKALAYEIVKIYHGDRLAKKAEIEFERIFKHKELPEEIKEHRLKNKDLKEGKIWIVKLLAKTGLAHSNSQARRLIQQGGVKLDGEKVTDINSDVTVCDGMVLQAGKRRFVKISLKNS